MILINVETAGLLAQLLPAFIVIFVFEQHRFAVGKRRHASSKAELLHIARKVGWRYALLVVPNVASLILCISFVQLGQGPIDKLEQAGWGNGGLPGWDHFAFRLTLLNTAFIYLSVLALLAYSTWQGLLLAYKSLTTGRLYDAALEEIRQNAHLTNPEQEAAVAMDHGVAKGKEPIKQEQETQGQPSSRGNVSRPAQRRKRRKRRKG